MERRHFIKVAGLSVAGAIGLPVCVRASEAQGGWRWCKKCEGLWFAEGGDDRKGKCPAGDGHDTTDSGRYVVTLNDDDAPGQKGWRWCKKCEGLWFAEGGDGRKGKCPAKGDHDTTDSGKYALALNNDDAPGQKGWRWCKQCEGLWFGGGGENRKGTCPGGGGHSEEESGGYALAGE